MWNTVKVEKRNMKVLTLETLRAQEPKDNGELTAAKYSGQGVHFIHCHVSMLSSLLAQGRLSKCAFSVKEE